MHVSGHCAFDQNRCLKINSKKMKAIISYKEISEYIAKQYGREVSLSKVADNEVNASVSQKVFIKTVRIGLNLKVEEVGPESVVLSYNGGFGIDLMVSGLMTFLKSKLPELSRIVTSEEDHRIRVNLANIDKARPVLERVTPQAIAFSEDSVAVTAALKL